MSISRNFEYSNKTLYDIKHDAARYTWAGYLVFVILSTCTGDAAILIASIKYKAFKLHKVIIAIIQHIAVCDLMVTAMFVFPTFVSLIAGGWVFGDILCSICGLASYYFTGVSVLLICVMTTSKLIILKYPFRSRSITLKKVHALCATSWLTSVSFPIIHFHLKDVHFDYRIQTCNYGHYNVSDLHIRRWLGPLTASLVMFIPTCVVVATTIHLIVVAKRAARHGQLQGGKSVTRQGITTVILTATIYCISILPFTVYLVVAPFLDVDDESKSLFHTHLLRIAVSVPSLNTISNFYIYSLTVPSFRAFVRTKIQQSYQFLSSTVTTISGGRRDETGTDRTNWTNNSGVTQESQETAT